MSIFDKLRTQKFLSFTLVLFTLSIGIVIGTLINSGVKAAKDNQAAPGATPLVIPNPVELSNAFTQIAKQVEPSVVNISTTYEPKAPARSAPRSGKRQLTPPDDQDQGDNGGMDEFFYRFFGGPSGNGAPEMPQRRGYALGSGVVVDQAGYILTNNHVVDKADRIQVQFTGDPTKYDAKVVGVDAPTDLAVIRVEGKKNLVAAKIGNSDAVQVGDWAIAIGSPFGLQATVTAGIISAKERDVDPESQYQHFLQTDAAINPGNSGGPLLNIRGEVIGINTAIATNSLSRGYQGVGFAMPMNMAAQVYNQIIKNGKVTRGGIGVKIAVSDTDTARALLKEAGVSEGAFVEAVTPGGGADKAGIKDGDIIVAVQGSLVTANYFDVLGVRAVLGRTFRPDEDQHPGGDTVAVVSYGFWSREFGSSPEVPGTRLTLNGTDYTVIGVTPPQFKGTFLFANSDQIWIPISMHTQVLAGFIEDHFLDRRFLDLNTVGRLKAGVTVRQAESAVETIASRLEQQYPKDNQGRGATLSPVADASLGINQHAQVVKAGVVMMGIVGVVLLIACVNLASLMLSQTARREKEMCLRAALGAGSRRLARQSLTESFLLSMLGGAVGLLLGYWGRWALWSERPAFLRQSDLALPLDGRVWAFTFAIAVLTAILFGLVPAWKVSRPTLMETLNSGGRSGSMAWGRSRFRQALVVSEVALALVALVGAALFLRSFAFAQGLDPGFESKRLFVMGFDLGSQHYDQDRGEQYFRDAIERAASSPGVQSAAVASNFPLGGGVGRTIFLEGQDAESGHRGTLTTLNDVSSGYFQTLGIPLHHGRAFNDLDRKETKPVAIVNHAMAKHFWPGESPLGKRFHFIGEMRLLEVVGEVGDSWQFGVGEDPQPVAYLPITQAYSPFAVLQVRTMGDPKTVLPSVRESVQSIDRNLAFVGVSTIEGLLDQGLWAPRMGAFLDGRFRAVGAAPGRRGHLRRAVVFSHTANSRGRYPHGPGRRSGIGAGPDREAGHDPRGNRRGHRRRGVSGTGAADDQPALRREGIRSPDLCRRNICAGRRRICSLPTSRRGGRPRSIP